MISFRARKFTAFSPYICNVYPVFCRCGLEKGVLSGELIEWRVESGELRVES